MWLLEGFRSEGRGAVIALRNVHVSETYVDYYDYDGDLWGDDMAVVDAHEESIRAEVSRRLGFEVDIRCIADGNGHMTWEWTRRSDVGGDGYACRWPYGSVK